MTPEKEAELFVKLDLLLGMVKDVQTQQRDHADRLSRLEGRLEEQSRLLHTLVPSRIAAVPPPAA